VGDPARVRGKLVEPRILRVERGGVPLYWAESAPPVRAGLAFRVGRADEALASAGVTRLVGQLALGGAGGEGQFDVGPTVSAFRVTGSPATATRFLRAVTDAVSTLPSKEAVAEARRKMPAAAPVGVAELALGLRWGGRGPGLARHEEYGLTWLGLDEVSAWRDAWFTTGNAVAWLCGPRLDAVDLALPDGARQPVAPLPPARTPTPAVVRLAAGAAAVSIVHRPSPELTAALDDLGAERLALTGEVEHALLSAPNVDELLRRLDAAPHQRLAPPARLSEPPGPGDLWRWCCGELFATGVTSRAEQAMARTWSSETSLGAAFGEALESALFLVDDEATLPGDVADGGGRWSAVPNEGVTHLPTTIDRAQPTKRLIVEATAITLVLDQQRAVRIALAGATSLRFADGGRGLWSAEGLYLDVHPADWERGEAAIAAIDRAIPASRTVPLVSARPRG
jgi:hypothetical protein